MKLASLALILAFGMPPSGKAVSGEETFQQGVEQYRCGRYREALASFENAREAGADVLTVQLFRGMCLGALEDLEPARACFEEVLSNSTRNGTVFLSIGEFWLQQGHPDEAAAVLRRGLRVEKDSAAILTLLARAYEELDRPETALQTLDRVVKLKPGDYETEVKKAELLRQLDRPAEARALAARLARERPTRPEAYEVLGRSPLSPLSAPAPAAAKKQPPTPNLVLVSIDTLRADRLHCYGNPRKTSPNIDAFARESVFFERAISQSPHTSPSHMTILTGMMPDVHQIANFNKDKGIVLSPRIETLAEILGRHGYRTAAFVGKGNLPADKGFSRGFERYEASFSRDTDGLDPVPSGVSRFLDEAQGGNRPFFLFIHHFFVHDPYIYGPESYRSRFLEPGVRVAGLPAGYADLAVRPKEDRAQLFWEAFDSSNPAHLAHLIALYDGGVFFADHIFGDIVELLKERDLFEKTIFVLLSDHGEEFYEHGNRGHLHLYVQELHVPLMVRFPGGEMAGRRVRETARTVDVFPTVLDLLGIDSGEIQGISMLPFLRKGAPYRPDIVSFSVIKPGGTVRVEEKGFSYSNEAPERLYDLASDPRESDNIVSRDPRERERLRSTAEERQRAKAAFIDRMGSPAESSPAEMTPEVEKEMRALGYL